MVRIEQKLKDISKNIELTDKVFLLGNKVNIYNYLKNSDILIFHLYGKIQDLY